MRDREFKQRAIRINANVPAGIIILLIGGVFLAKQLGVVFPSWLFSWEMILIAIGVLVGIKSKFRDFSWLILVGIGLVFLADDVFPIKHLVWPVAIIIVGLIIILRPGRQKKTPQIADAEVIDETTAVREDILDVTSVFGGTKKIVLSKNFRGGEVVSIFGGSEINLTQADFPNAIKIEVVAIFGGTTLIVPANWEIRSETVAIFGGIDDKRDPATMTNPEKIIVLEGTVIFGGIEIKSYG